jgi:hypothetical protein
MGQRRKHAVRKNFRVRIHAPQQAAIPPISPVYRAGDRYSDARSPGGGAERRTFAQSLRASNLDIEWSRELAGNDLPYAQYLKSLNDQDDLAARVQGQTWGGGGAGTGQDLCRSGPQRRDERALIGAGDSRAECPSLSNAPPRLGDAPSPRDVAAHEVIQVAYGVRNLLNRGSIIDLAG